MLRKWFPSYLSSEITDESKAGKASKTFACIQILWSFLQCFERSLQRLPLTLLEIVTMAHCVCGLIIRFLRWGKPFSVEQPTITDGEKMSAILSYMWMSSAVSCSWDGCSSDDCSETEFDSMLFCRDMVNRDAPPNGVSSCHRSYSCIDIGAITAGERSRLSRIILQTKWLLGPIPQ
jgi:hypothetical protein